MGRFIERIERQPTPRIAGGRLELLMGTGAVHQPLERSPKLTT